MYSGVSEGASGDRGVLGLYSGVSDVELGIYCGCLVGSVRVTLGVVCGYV